jgi:hypothetical protein
LIERVARATPPASGRPPKVNIAPRQVAGLKQKLIVYHRDFAGLVRRKEQRVWSLKYFEGQLLDLKRKSIEPMSTAVDGGNQREKHAAYLSHRKRHLQIPSLRTN